MPLLYSISRWDDIFEKSQSRKAKNHFWVAMPIKHDGSGFRRITIQDNATDLFAAWILIVQVAAKCPVRGVLANEKGYPLDSEDLAIKTGFKPSLFDSALEFFSNKKIGWIDAVEWERATSQIDSATNATNEKPSATGQIGLATTPEAHSTVQYKQTNNRDDVVFLNLIEKHPEYLKIQNCKQLSSITIERYAEMLRSFPNIKNVSDEISSACFKAGAKDVIDHPEGWLLAKLRYSTPKGKLTDAERAKAEWDKLK